MDASSSLKDQSRAGDIVNLDNEYEVRQWTEIFAISEDQLKDAVRAVGTCRADVKRYVVAKRRL